MKTTTYKSFHASDDIDGDGYAESAYWQSMNVRTAMYEHVKGEVNNPEGDLRGRSFNVHVLSDGHTVIVTEADGMGLGGPEGGLT